jgi:hypothetical protein
MSADKAYAEINIDEIKELLVEEGFEVISGGEEGVFQVKELESGIVTTCVLENNILFNTVSCITVPEEKLTLELTRLLLDAENGISTSSFQLYHTGGGKAVITLNNFCKLQDLGDEDKDDIISCLDFLDIDVVMAKDLLADLLG